MEDTYGRVTTIRHYGPSILVGMIGRKRSGKDSVAKVLIEEEAFTRFAFADNVRQAALDLDPIVVVTGGSYSPGAVPPKTFRLSQAVETLGWEKAKEIPEVRRTLQRFGSESIRRLDPEFWVRATMEQVEQVRTPVVITDVRFPNEAVAVRAAGGVIVRVEREGLDLSDTHISETALDDLEADFTIDNSGTLEDLANATRLLYRRL